MFGKSKGPKYALPFLVCLLDLFFCDDDLIVSYALSFYFILLVFLVSIKLIVKAFKFPITMATLQLLAIILFQISHLFVMSFFHCCLLYFEKKSHDKGKYHALCTNIFRSNGLGRLLCALFYL